MSFVSLHTSLSGIRAARVGMDTTSHNIANANTPGHTRQRVDLATRYAYLSPEGPVGTGVSVEDISRARDAFLDDRVRGDVARRGELDVRADLLARAEEVLGEPGQGLTSELSEVWAAFEELALRPDDGAARRQVLSSLESLSSRARTVSGQLQTLGEDAELRLSQSVSEANVLFARVAELNRSIQDASAGGGSPNDLLDTRDRVLDDLSELVGARATTEDDGSARVSVAGMTVVSGSEVRELSVDGTDVVHPSGLALRAGGEVAGQQRFLAEDLPELRDRLDAFVGDFVTQLNDQHADGHDLDGLAGGTLLQATSSADLRVRVTDPARVAAASQPDQPHNGENADALAQLRTTTGLDDALRSLVTEHAAAVQAAGRAADGQRQLTSASTSVRESMHGVSLDEEMVNMLSHQRALEASSRMMTAADQALDTLINRTGLVGR